MVGQDPVDLLGHGPVEGAQPRLQVGHRDVQLDGRQGRGQRRVRVPVDQDPVRGQGRQGLIERSEHRPGLGAVPARAHTQVDIGRRDPQVGEEDVGEHRVVVLPGVDDDVLHPGSSHGVGDRGELDELGPGPDDGDNAHGPILCAAQVPMRGRLLRPRRRGAGMPYGLRNLRSHLAT